MKFKFLTLIAASLALLTFSSCQKGSDTDIEDEDDDTYYRQETDDVLIKIPFAAYVSEGNFEGATKYIVDRLKNCKQDYDNVKLMIFNNTAIAKVSDDGYDLITDAFADGATLILDNPTLSVLTDVDSKIYSSLVRLYNAGTISEEGGEAVMDVISYFDYLCDQYKGEEASRMPDYVAVSPYSVYSTPSSYEASVESIQLDSLETVEETANADQLSFEFNDYDYGQMADLFASMFVEEAVSNDTKSSNGEVNPKAHVEHVIMPVVYDLRNVSYEREKSQVVPAMPMEFTRTILPVYTVSDNRDHYIVNQTLVAPFRLQGVRSGKKWWQIGHRHYGPYLWSLEIKNSMRVGNGSAPDGLWVKDAKPTNAYATRTYSESATMGVSSGITIGEKPSCNLGISYSEGISIAQTCPVVKTEDCTSGVNPYWKFNLNQGQPTTHRNLDYSVSHDQLDATVFQNHTYSQAWEWVIDNSDKYQGADIIDNVNIVLKQRDLGYKWKNGAHLQTVAKYNELTFTFSDDFHMPKLERYIQKWDVYVEDCKDDITRMKVRDILSNHVLNYFEDTFSLPTVNSDDTRRIDAVIAETVGSVTSNKRAFKEAGVTSFTLRWQRQIPGTTTETYKVVSFSFQ